MLQRRLQDKVALVTGGSRGIGAAICRRFAREGANVVLTFAHDAESAERICDEIVLTGVTCEAIRCDIEIPSQIESLFASLQKNHGRLDILVNNAAVGELLLPLPEGNSLVALLCPASSVATAIDATGKAVARVEINPNDAKKLLFRR